MVRCNCRNTADQCQLPPLVFLAVAIATSAAVRADMQACPDGSPGLTQAVYESGNKTAWSSATCVPQKAFAYYAGDLTLNGGDFDALVSIEASAFLDMSGTMRMTGAFNALETIMQSAFARASHHGCEIHLTALPRLVHVHGFTFGHTPSTNLKGAISFPPGPFPNYDGCGTRVIGPDVVLLAPGETPLTIEAYETQSATGASFEAVTCIPGWSFFKYDKAVTLVGADLQMLARVGDHAFYLMSGEISFAGGFPSLLSIATYAFYKAGTQGDNSTVEITCSSAAAPLDINSCAFIGFEGVHVSTGEQACCGGCTTTSTGTGNATVTSTAATGTSVRTVTSVPSASTATTAGTPTTATAAAAGMISTTAIMTATTTVTTVSTTMTTATSTADENSSGNKRGNGNTVAAYLVSLLGVPSVVGAVVWCHKRQQQKKQLLQQQQQQGQGQAGALNKPLLHIITNPTYDVDDTGEPVHARDKGHGGCSVGGAADGDVEAVA